MRRQRVIIVLISLVVAVVGTALIVSAATRQRDEALAATHSVSVLVASERIQPGTTGAAARALVQRANIPASALVPGVLTDLDSVVDLRAIAPIFPGQQIVNEQWSDSPVSDLRPPPGTLGLAVQLGDPQRVAGFVTPGSHVALFATLTVAGEREVRTRLMLSPITVLGVGSSTLTTRTTQEAGSTSTEQVPSAILTLALTPSQAERVVFATTQGELYLGLLGEKVRTPPSAGVTSTSVFGGLQ